MANKKNKAKKGQGKVKEVKKVEKASATKASASTNLTQPKPKPRPRTTEEKQRFREEYETAQLLVSLKQHGDLGPGSAGESDLDSTVFAAMSQIFGTSEGAEHRQEKSGKVERKEDATGEEAGEGDEGDTSDNSDESTDGEEVEPQTTAETMPANKTKGKRNPYVRASSSDEETSELENYEISFKVPCGQAQREVTIPSSATWKTARSIIADAMDREPSLLRLGYHTLPWDKHQKTTMATLLQKDLEWERLTDKVLQYVRSEKAKNRGHGVVKPFTITLVSVGDHGAAAGSSAKHAATTGTVEQPSDGEKSSGRTYAEVVDDLLQRHQCNKCQKPCIVIPGPPVQHRHLTHKAAGKWAFKILAGQATPAGRIPEMFVPDLGAPVEYETAPLPVPAPGAQDAPAVTTTPAPALPTSAPGLPSASIHDASGMAAILSNPTALAQSFALLGACLAGAQQLPHALPYMAPPVAPVFPPNAAQVLLSTLMSSAPVPPAFPQLAIHPALPYATPSFATGAPHAPVHGGERVPVYSHILSHYGGGPASAGASYLPRTPNHRRYDHSSHTPPTRRTPHRNYRGYSPYPSPSHRRQYRNSPVMRNPPTPGSHAVEHDYVEHDYVSHGDNLNSYNLNSSDRLEFGGDPDDGTSYDRSGAAYEPRYKFN